MTPPTLPSSPTASGPALLPGASREMDTGDPFARGLIPGQQLEGHKAICGQHRVHMQALPVPPGLPGTSPNQLPRLSSPYFCPLPLDSREQLSPSGPHMWPIRPSGHGNGLLSGHVTQSRPTRVHPGLGLGNAWGWPQGSAGEHGFCSQPDLLGVIFKHHEQILYLERKPNRGNNNAKSFHSTPCVPSTVLRTCVCVSVCV